MPTPMETPGQSPSAARLDDLTCLTCNHYRPVPADRRSFVEFAGVCLAPDVPATDPFRTRIIVEPAAPCPGFP